MLKQIRIDGTSGKIVVADREVHTITSGPGGPDQVQWIVVPGGRTFTIRFRYLAGSPFQAGHSPTNPHNISVPPGAPSTVTQGKGKYKYDVIDDAGTVTDDPDVIIE